MSCKASPSARAPNLDKAEIDRMIADAERNSVEDARLRQEVDARNELDAAAYQVERELAPWVIRCQSMRRPGQKCWSLTPGKRSRSLPLWTGCAR